jgi:hypothetical protein
MVLYFLSALPTSKRMKLFFCKWRNRGQLTVPRWLRLGLVLAVRWRITMAKESEGTPTAQAATRPAETAASNPEDLDTNGRLPGWRGLLRQALDKTRQEQPATNRRELGRDRTRTLFILVAAVITVLLFFLGVFSSPNRNKGRAIGRPGVPDLGKRITPGQQAASADGSVTPLLNAQNGNSENQDRDSVTAEEVGRTAHPSRPRTSSTTAPKNPGPYALGRIDFSDPVAKETRAASERLLHGMRLRQSSIRFQSAPNCR